MINPNKVDEFRSNIINKFASQFVYGGAHLRNMSYKKSGVLYASLKLKLRDQFHDIEMEVRDVIFGD